MDSTIQAQLTQQSRRASVPHTHPHTHTHTFTLSSQLTLCGWIFVCMCFNVQQFLTNQFDSTKFQAAQCAQSILRTIASINVALQLKSGGEGPRLNLHAGIGVGQV